MMWSRLAQAATGFAVLVVSVATVSVAAQAQEVPPPGTREVTIGFEGGCRDTSTHSPPVPLPPPAPGPASMLLVVPESVEPGQEFTVQVLAVDGDSSPVFHVFRSAAADVTGATPATIDTGLFFGPETFTLTTTGAGGTDVVIRLA